ncbi:MAG: putative permease [Candidatus Azotimanducaceae bacterium]|jgi:predicted permease
MNIFRNAFLSGIARIFSLPRLSVPLILTLGLTLGAVLSVIAISSTLLIKPLPGVHDEASIETFEYRLKISETMSISYWNLRRLADFNESFAQLGTWAAIGSSERDVMIDGVTYVTTQHTASNTIMDVLGTRLIKGEDVRIENPENYIWISNSFWQGALGGLDAAIGKQLDIESKQYIIAGVLEDMLAAQGNEPILNEQVWLITDLKTLLGEPEVMIIDGVIDALLLRRGSTDAGQVTQAQATAWVEDFISTNSDPAQAPGYLIFMRNTPIDVISSDYRSKLLGELGDTNELLIALFAAVFGLLIMATLNLLNLFIAHYQGRTKEFAIQMTLGASLLRVRTLVFLENLPSFIIAAITGLLITGWVIKSLPALAASNLPMVETIGIDGMTISASFVIVLLLNALFSALALVDINKQALVENLNSSGKGLQAQSNQWISRGLMVVQLSIASILLTASVMLALQSYDAVYKDLGYRIDNFYEVSFTNTDEAWVTQLADAEEYQGSEYQQLHEAIDKVIESTVVDSQVVINSVGALNSNMQGNVYFPEGTDQRIIYQGRELSANYFDEFEIPMVAGANVTAAQIANKERRVVIDTGMADAVFPGVAYEDVIGQSLKLVRDRPEGEVLSPDVVTGIVLATQSRAGTVALNRMPAVFSTRFRASRNVDVTVKMPPGKPLTTAMLAAEMQRQFPRLKNLQVRSLQDIWAEQTLRQRLSLWVVLTVTALTLLLAAIGVSGLTQMTTNQRKYELAIRMATGAKQSALIQFILKDATSMLIVGLSAGFIIAVLGYPSVKAQLDMLPAFSWLAMAVLDLGLVVIVLLSVFVPAWRVVSADPMHALRQE